MEEGMVLEVREDDALVMQKDGAVVRVRRRNGMETGQKLFILPEDVLGTPGSKTVPFRRAGSWSRRLAAMAAMLALVLTLALPRVSAKACSVVSFDGPQALEVKLNDRHQVVEASSADGSVPEEVLKQLKGRPLEDLKTLLDSGRVLVGYARLDDDDEDDDRDEELEELLEELLEGKTAVYLCGSAEDAAAAREQALSLGRYILLSSIREERENQKEPYDTEELRELYEEIWDDLDDLDDVDDEDDHGDEPDEDAGDDDRDSDADDAEDADDDLPDEVEEDDEDDA